MIFSENTARSAKLDCKLATRVGSKSFSGNTNETRGTGFVVYEDIFDAKSACEHLQGFNIQGRYLVVLYHQPAKQAKKIDNVRKEADLEELKRYFLFLQNSPDFS